MLRIGNTVSSPTSPSSDIRVRRRAASMLEYSAPCTPAVTRSFGPGERPRRMVQGIERPGSGSTKPDQRSWPALAGTVSGICDSSRGQKVRSADPDAMTAPHPCRLAAIGGIAPDAHAMAADDVAHVLHGGCPRCRAIDRAVADGGRRAP